MFMSPKRTTSFCVVKNKLQKFTSSFPSLLVTSLMMRVVRAFEEDTLEQIFRLSIFDPAKAENL